LKGGRVSRTADLAPGAFRQYAVGAGIPADTPPGDYFLCATVDPGGAVPESNEGNNTTCRGSGFSRASTSARRKTSRSRRSESSAMRKRRLLPSVVLLSLSSVALFAQQPGPPRPAPTIPTGPREPQPPGLKAPP